MLFKTIKVIKLKPIVLTVLICLSHSLYSQKLPEKIIKSYEDFSSLFRETAYVHLNKSVFVKNESIGFKAYVFDRIKKVNSKETSNLYCTILDKNNQVIKRKLVRVEKGVANNVFEVDSLFTSGTYTFRAYTNWMRNFKDRDYYEHSFMVIDPSNQKELKEKVVTSTYQIQVFPESGHLIQNSQNSIGILVKNKEGFGLPNAKGVVKNQQNKVVGEFQLNRLGIGKVSVRYREKEVYRIIVENESQKITLPLPKAKEFGFNFSVLNMGSSFGILFKTNKKTLEKIKNKHYKLVLHNGHKLKVIPFRFTDRTQKSMILDAVNLFPGMNTITIFDADKNIPILERLYFNRNSLAKTQIHHVSSKKQEDSIEVSLKVNDIIDAAKLQSLSVSVLPQETKSYNFNSNIMSKLHLESYVRGFVQDAWYYFASNNTKVDEDLDNLLITQGWSSYDWNNVFVKKEPQYFFEHGIDVTAQVNNKKEKQSYIFYPLKNNASKVLTADKSNTFQHKDLFPEGDEKYRISILESETSFQKPELYLRFSLSSIPQLNTRGVRVPFRNNLLIEDVLDNNYTIPFIGKGEGRELLNEIVVSSKTDATRTEKIKNRSYGRVEFFDDKKRVGGYYLHMYLAGKGIVGRESETQKTKQIVYNFYDRLSLNGKTNRVDIYVDDILYNSHDYFKFYSLEVVDYIEINRGGLGSGLLGGRTVVKIVTDPSMILKRKTSYNSFGEYPFPITFSPKKKFYTPIYPSHNSVFYRKYGVISWQPEVTLNAYGEATFKIPDLYKGEVNLYIEGVVNGNKLISQTKTIEVE